MSPAAWFAREIERFVDCEVSVVPKIGGVVHTVEEIYREIAG